MWHEIIKFLQFSVNWTIWIIGFWPADDAATVGHIGRRRLPARLDFHYSSFHCCYRVTAGNPTYKIILYSCVRARAGVWRLTIVTLLCSPCSRCCSFIFCTYLCAAPPTFGPTPVPTPIWSRFVIIISYHTRTRECVRTHRPSLQIIIIIIINFSGFASSPGFIVVSSYLWGRQSLSLLLKKETLPCCAPFGSKIMPRTADNGTSSSSWILLGKYCRGWRGKHYPGPTLVQTCLVFVDALLLRYFNSSPMTVVPMPVHCSPNMLWKWSDWT